MGRENQIKEERLRKIKELRKLEINPYPSKADKRENIEKCLKLKLGSSVKTAGRIITKRDIGKIIFANLEDFSGKIQIVFQDGETPKKQKDFFEKFIDVGDFVQVEGKIFRTKTKELSILVEKVGILSKAVLPLPTKFYGLKDKEERYRKRYLDLVMNPEVKKIFAIRQKVVDSMRKFLHSEGFLEVDTPILQPMYGGASARPFESKLNALKMKVYMRISNEMYLKRLIGGGYEKIFEFCKDFRNEGIDAVHNPEFTQMETMWAYGNYEDNMKFGERMFSFILKEVLGKDKINYQGKLLDFKTPWRRINFRDLILEKAKIDIDRENTFEKLKKAIIDRKIEGVDIKSCLHYGALLDEMYKRVVRPQIIQPTYLMHYPSEMIALAKRNEKDETKVNVFQLLVNGSEILKSYDELNDPEELEKRLKEQMKLLRSGDDSAMPIDEDFITMLKYGMPPTSGFGIGIDRLVMILTNQPSIRDVIFFPFMK
jgi:lysyl-tRNA synthetase class 2